MWAILQYSTPMRYALLSSPFYRWWKMRFGKLKEPIQDHMSVKRWILGWFLILIVEPVLLSLSSLSLSQLKIKKSLQPHSFQGIRMHFGNDRLCDIESPSSFSGPVACIVPPPCSNQVLSLWSQAHSRVSLPPAPAHVPKYVCSAPHFFQVSLCPSSPK